MAKGSRPESLQGSGLEPPRFQILTLEHLSLSHDQHPEQQEVCKQLVQHLSLLKEVAWGLEDIED